MMRWKWHKRAAALAHHLPGLGNPLETLDCVDFLEYEKAAVEMLKSNG